MLNVFIPFLSPHFSQSIISLFPVLDTYMWVVIVDELFLFSFPLHTFSFLVTCDPPLPMCHQCICVLFLLYTTIVLVQCTSIVIIIFYLHLSFSSCLVWCPSFVSWWSFCHCSSHCVLFFSLLVFYVAVHPIFSGVHPNFTAVYSYYSVGQIIRTSPLCQFPTAFCRLSL